MRMAVRALLFDLFGTVVHFAARVPIVEVAGARWVTTMGWLQPLVAEKIPDVSFDALLNALMATTEEIVRERPPEYHEVPSRERFRRALAKVGISGVAAMETAQQLSLVHMQHLASTTFLPEGHADVLAALQAKYRLGLVSNFDHGPTARRVLEMHGIDRYFEVILISDEFGRRKPHRSIFDAACERLQATSSEALFIGDNPKEDIAAAHAAGLTPVWVSAAEEPATTEARFVIRSLRELPGILGSL